jgi:hypothetical protein
MLWGKNYLDIFPETKGFPDFIYRKTGLLGCHQRALGLSGKRDLAKF